LNPYDYNLRDIQQIVEQYQQLKMFNTSLYREFMDSYCDMAVGGDGGPLGFVPEDWAQICVDGLLPVDTEPTCRAYNYPGYSNEFFLSVLSALNEAEFLDYNFGV